MAAPPPLAHSLFIHYPATVPNEPGISGMTLTLGLATLITPWGGCGGKGGCACGRTRARTPPQVRRRWR